MRAEPEHDPAAGSKRAASPRRALASVALAAVVGLGLIADSARRTSATYDEVAYLRIASRWWRTGDQTEITRMGSPLTFWKIQQAPVLWSLDRTGRGALIDHPIERQAELLPLVRMGASWVWLLAFTLTVCWTRQLYGPGAMTAAAWLFTLSPNLLAHGSLVTMELPLVAATAGVFLLFGGFLNGGGVWNFVASAVVAGLAFSCKFTAVLLPPLLALGWWVERVAVEKEKACKAALAVARGMVAFVVLMVVADLVVTGFARLPLAHETGAAHPSLERVLGPSLARRAACLVETPIPQDWVGFVTQIQHQRSGGSSYLLGERRLRGWWYYYLVALAVKVPLTFGLLVGARVVLAKRRGWARGDRVLPLTIVAFLGVTLLGSSRNYGVRYLLPLAPLAVAWVSALGAEKGWWRWAVWLGILGQGVAVAGVHPNELTYFNILAGGPIGGRRVLADSNLDWGQGLRSLRRLQAARPELRDLTLYDFGDTEPRHYGVVGTCHVIDASDDHPGLPPLFRAETRFVAVSASLQWGPWGPARYFEALRGVLPVAMTDDTTIAVYRVSDVPMSQ